MSEKPAMIEREYLGRKQRHSFVSVYNGMQNETLKLQALVERSNHKN